MNEDLTMTTDGLKSDKRIREEAEEKNKDNEDEDRQTPPVASPAVPKPGIKDSVNKKDSVYHYNGQVNTKPAAATDETDDANEADEANNTANETAKQVKTIMPMSPLAAVFRM